MSTSVPKSSSIPAPPAPQPKATVSASVPVQSNIPPPPPMASSEGTDRSSLLDSIEGFSSKKVD
jgi:hypothetical protein